MQLSSDMSLLLPRRHWTPKCLSAALRASTRRSNEVRRTRQGGGLAEPLIVVEGSQREVKLAGQPPKSTLEVRVCRTKSTLLST